jgi:hypothetical protein
MGDLIPVGEESPVYRGDLDEVGAGAHDGDDLFHKVFCLFGVLREKREKVPGGHGLRGFEWITRIIQGRSNKAEGERKDER